MAEQAGRPSGVFEAEEQADGAMWDAVYALYFWAHWCGNPDDEKNEKNA